MIKVDYILNNKTNKRSLETDVAITGPTNLLRIELGMILYYLIKTKQIDKETIDNLNDIVNDAVSNGLTNDDMLKQFLKAAYGLTI